MTKARGFTEDDLAQVSDNPEWTDEELANAKPLSAFAPELAAALRRGRGPQRAPTKTKVSLRLEQSIIDHFKATGEGWQTRMGDVLKKAAGL